MRLLNGPIRSIEMSNETVAMRAHFNRFMVHFGFILKAPACNTPLSPSFKRTQKQRENGTLKIVINFSFSFDFESALQPEKKWWAQVRQSEIKAQRSKRHNQRQQAISLDNQCRFYSLFLRLWYLKHTNVRLVWPKLVDAKLQHTILPMCKQCFSVASEPIRWDEISTQTIWTVENRSTAVNSWYLTIARNTFEDFQGTWNDNFCLSTAEMPRKFGEFGILIRWQH